MYVIIQLGLDLRKARFHTYNYKTYTISLSHDMQVYTLTNNENFPGYFHCGLFLSFFQICTNA